LLAFAAIAGIAAHRAAQAWWPVAPQALPPPDWPLPPTPARDRWQSWNPIPITAGVSGFWATAPNDVWAWGGTQVMRWNGRAWTRIDAPIKQTIRAIWGAPKDVWLRAWNYTPWSGNAHLIKPGHVDTSLFHWDGLQWSSVESRRMPDDRGRNSHDWPPSFVERLAPPPDVARVVGRDELTALWVRHAAGRVMPAFQTGYRTGGDEIWTAEVGGGQLGHFDGRAWAVGQRLLWSGDLSAVRMTGNADGWALSRTARTYGRTDPPPRNGLFRWDGRAWRFFRPVPERMHALWASGPADVWAVGEHGLVMHWDGGRWSEQRLAGDFHAIWGRARDDVWINGCADKLYHWNGAAWNHVPNPIPRDNPGVCFALSGASATDVQAIGGDRFMRWNGVAWTDEHSPLDGEVPVGRSPRITALWRAPPSGDLWAVGAEDVDVGFDGWPVVLCRTGGFWSKLPTPRIEGYLSSVWGTRNDDVWAVGTKGLILHWDGATWTKEESGVVEPLSSVHGAGGTVWIVGDSGTVLVRSLGSAGSG
jgi:hypothetical protein